MRTSASLPVVAAAVLFGAAAVAQGPASCGFHLDIIADLTSTHAAVADIPGAPGTGFAGIPAGAPGNPYTAHASPGTQIKLRLSVPPGTLGPAPFGPGSPITIFYGIGTPNLPVFPIPAGLVAPCVPGQPLIVSVLPIAGTIVDGVTAFPPPPTPPADPGFPHTFEVVLGYPATVILPPIMFQAVLLTPAGMLAVSNAAGVLPGPNPFEVSLVPGLVPSGAFPATDEGYALGVPTPPGFMFYGVPAPACDVNTNGFIAFPFGAFPFTDFAGTPGDFGCAPATATAMPRVDVNHYDVDLGIPAPAPLVPDLTMELAPPLGPGTASRTIIRWKNAPSFGSPPPLPDTNHASFVCELWGMDLTPSMPPGPIIVPPMVVNRIVCVRQEVHSVTAFLHDQIGIGPGTAAQGYGGPPPACLFVLWPTWGFPPGLAGLPADSLSEDGPLDGHVASNLAFVFLPALGFVPAPYTALAY